MIKETFTKIIIFLLFCVQVKAQSPPLKNYVIFTFEDSYKKTEHGVKKFYWIISQDSIKEKGVQSRLYLTSISKNNVIDCCSGKAIDPFIIEPSTNFILESDYSENLDFLKTLIDKNRKKLQILTKKWLTGKSEKTIIYATPVSGKFCSSSFALLGQLRTGYHGKVYIPYSSFQYNPIFWKSNDSKYIFQQDFSKVTFDIVPN